MGFFGPVMVGVGFNLLFFWLFIWEMCAWLGIERCETAVILFFKDLSIFFVIKIIALFREYFFAFIYLSFFFLSPFLSPCLGSNFPRFAHPQSPPFFSHPNLSVFSGGGGFFGGT